MIWNYDFLAYICTSIYILRMSLKYFPFVFSANASCVYPAKFGWIYATGVCGIGVDIAHIPATDDQVKYGKLLMALTKHGTWDGRKLSVNP